jgi:hypothetical protein
MWQPAALIGRVGWGAARSQWRPGRRPAAQHPGARPVPSRRTRVRGGHAPSVCRRTHLADTGRPGRRCRASVPGQPDQAVQRIAVYAERTAFRAAWLRDGVQALRITGASGIPPVRACRCGGPVADQRPGPGRPDWPTADQSKKRTERPETGGPCPPRQECRTFQVGVATQPAGQDTQGTPSASGLPVRRAAGQASRWTPSVAGPPTQPGR